MYITIAMPSTDLQYNHDAYGFHRSVIMLALEENSQ